MQPPAAVVVSLETAEIEASSDFYRAASADVADACGLSVAESAGATITAASTIDVLAINRAIGLGLRRAPSDAELDELLAAFARIGSPRFFVPVAPTPGAATLPARLERRGLRHHNNWIRLRRELTDLPEAPASAVGVRQIGPSDQATFGRIVAEAFAYPPSFAPLPGQTIGRTNWRHYLAYLDGEAVASAAMHVAGEAAWFGFAATDEAHRGHGAQTALVIQRLHDALATGCRWVSVETAEQTAERRAPSYRNLIRLGFEVAYKRPNYLWTRG